MVGKTNQHTGQKCTTIGCGQVFFPRPGKNTFFPSKINTLARSEKNPWALDGKKRKKPGKNRLWTSFPPVLEKINFPSKTRTLLPNMENFMKRCLYLVVIWQLACSFSIFHYFCMLQGWKLLTVRLSGTG